MAITDTFNNIFGPILDPVFGILLKLPPFWGIFVITLIVTLITLFIYKKMTDQVVLKGIREDMTKLRKDMKEATNNPAKLAELQKISMEKSMIQMRETMKPMLVTMLPILIIFGWFAGHLAYYPIQPDTQFSINLTFKDNINGDVEIVIPTEIESINGKIQKIENNKAGFLLKGQEGDYNLNFIFNNNTYSKDLLISKERKYKNPDKLINLDLRTIKVSNEPVRVFGLSWFWVYLILAIVINSVLRKVLKIN
ncbi:MAG: EMC3/TMCO1 family protein [Candidatus Nanoarchaeia archaeon]|nr:EMC3/TMCO1 family protein [Candidatus Nanoarchaeia archaeon]